MLLGRHQEEKGEVACSDMVGMVGSDMGGSSRVRDQGRNVDRAGRGGSGRKGDHKQT